MSEDRVQYGNANPFEKATKKRARLRMAIDGPSGSGKTYTSLIFATALANGGRVAVIDTERGSASLYADKFDFDVLELSEFAPEAYTKGIKAAEAAGYDVIVLDSLSHAWEGKGGILEMHDKEVSRSRTGNSWAAWRNVTPKHRALVDTILQSKCHIIATMRSKMAYVQSKDENGKVKIEKVGLAPIQRQGMEYEFTVVADMDIDHTMVVSKSRCSLIADDVEAKPDAEWFGKLKAWLESGDAVAEEPIELPVEEPVEEPENREPAAETAQQEPPKANGNGNGKGHWSENKATRQSFFGVVGLTADQVHKALGVEHLRDYPGKGSEAIAICKKWAAEQAVAEQQEEAKRGIAAQQYAQLDGLPEERYA